MKFIAKYFHFRFVTGASTSGNFVASNRNSTLLSSSIIDLDSPSVSRTIATCSNETGMGKFQSHVQNDGITGNF